MNRDSLRQSLQNNRIQRLESSNKPSMPSLPKMVTNAAQAVVRNVQSVAAGNDLRLSSDEANSRLSVCKGCEFFDKNQERCGKCGCFMALKTYLKAERCPVGKW
ncbi:MAG: hypothetical protein EBU90_00760 [Proteobacteria bacterium]|nr:hypothetical protein [Pseudomonadota bacterium]NBP12963.1 hypothetical protein [bacterium]